MASLDRVFQVMEGFIDTSSKQKREEQKLEHTSSSSKEEGEQRPTSQDGLRSTHRS
jgi:hypothetical protein